MHEYAVVENIVALAGEQAGNYSAKKVTKINLVIGELTSIEPEALEMYFEILSQGTILEGAELSFKTIAAELKCEECGEIFEKKRSIIECPKCRKLGRFTGKGYEFFMESIEIE